jgi:hypothetical protein
VGCAKHAHVFPLYNHPQLKKSPGMPRRNWRAHGRACLSRPLPEGKGWGEGIAAALEVHKPQC